MRFATLRTGSADGMLVMIDDAGSHAVQVAGVPTLQALVEDWPGAGPALSQAAALIAAGKGDPIASELLGAPLPRAWQWLDGSAYRNHGALMEVAFGHDPLETSRPLMYQGLSDKFHGPTDPVPLPSAEHGIDFEGEYGVIVDRVPMGTPADRAIDHIKLVVQINDWSLRALAPAEMKTGFGWVQAKPACSMAPFAVTPDQLGAAWRDGRVGLDLAIEWNGKPFGHANGAPMDFGFHELIAHAAATRELVAGTVIGSGTVSNTDYATVGSSCISEVRAIEMIASGHPKTPFMAFGDRVRMEARDASGTAPFGAIDQVVVQA